MIAGTAGGSWPMADFLPLKKESSPKAAPFHQDFIGSIGIQISFGHHDHEFQNNFPKLECIHM